MVLVLMLMLPLLPQGIITLSTSAGTYGDFYYTVSDGKVTITGYYNRTVNKVIIPSTSPANRRWYPDPKLFEEWKRVIL